LCPILEFSARNGSRTRVECQKWIKTWRSTPQMASAHGKLKLSPSTHQVGPG
ncbi:hypothetical protein HN51_055946, partial [Arachis hypogaea]